MLVYGNNLFLVGGELLGVALKTLVLSPSCVDEAAYLHSYKNSMSLANYSNNY